MIKHYKKKPVIIEAVQYDGTVESAKEIDEFTNHTVTMAPVSSVLYIQTLEGLMEASVGDYIIKGIKGEFYPCKPDIFEQTYEEYFEVRSNVKE